MPTYVCWTRAGNLSDEQRRNIAKAITEAHHEIALAPRYLVQVIFNEVELGRHFVAGNPAPDAQMWVRADIRTGRTDDQKSKLMQMIIDDICAITKALPEQVWVYINDIPGSSIMEFGQVLPRPGEEAAWFAGLPPELQEKLRKLS